MFAYLREVAPTRRLARAIESRTKRRRTSFRGLEGAIAVLWLGVLLTLVFWYLDSYFLWQERLFRSLYDHVRGLKEEDIDFGMDQMRFKKNRPFYKAVLSATLWPFYLLAALAQVYFIRSLT